MCGCVCSWDRVWQSEREHFNAIHMHTNKWLNVSNEESEEQQQAAAAPKHLYNDKWDKNEYDFDWAIEDDVEYSIQNCIIFQWWSKIESVLNTNLIRNTIWKSEQNKERLHRKQTTFKKIMSTFFVC